MAEWIIWNQIPEREGKGSVHKLALIHPWKKYIQLKIYFGLNFNACKRLRYTDWDTDLSFSSLGEIEHKQCPCNHPETWKKGEAYKCFSDVRIKVSLAIFWKEKRSCLGLWSNHPESFSKRPWITLFDKVIKIWKAEEVTQYILKFIENRRHFDPVNMTENWTKSSQKDLQQKG